jgi:hypothetical protein
VVVILLMAEEVAVAFAEAMEVEEVVAFAATSASLTLATELALAKAALPYMLRQ